MELLIIIISSLCILLFLLQIVYKVWWKPKSLERKLRNQGIKGTPYRLLYGDKKQINKMTMEACSHPLPLNHAIVPRVAPFFHHMVQTYGKICVSWFGTRPRLIITDSELVKLILTNKDNHFIKPPSNPLMELLTKGLLTLDGQKWSKRRRLITPAFHHEKILGMVPAFSDCCYDLVDRLDQKVGSSSVEIDMAAELQAFSLDVIARTAFGSSYKDGEKIFGLQREQVLLVMETESTYFPGYRFIPTKKNRRRYELDRQMKAILRDMIQKRSETPNKSGEENIDLLGLLLQCKEDDNSEITVDDIIEECKLFYFAGQETTANLLTWTLVLLSMHQNWQEKVRDEIYQVCGKKRRPELHDLNHLKIVTMVLQEVLRLYPAVVALARLTNHTTKVGSLSIPAGVEVYMPTVLMHYDKGYWGEDVEEFNPERFVGGVSKASSSKINDQVMFFPFGWGPRICLGQSFAMMEAKLALVMLLQRFSFELSPLYSHAPFTVITVRPQYGAPLILHPIDN